MSNEVLISRQIRSTPELTLLTHYPLWHDETNTLSLSCSLTYSLWQYDCDALWHALWHVLWQALWHTLWHAFWHAHWQVPSDTISLTQSHWHNLSNTISLTGSLWYNLSQRSLWHNLCGTISRTWSLWHDLSDVISLTWSLWHVLSDTLTHPNTMKIWQETSLWQYKETCLRFSPPMCGPHLSIYIFATGIHLFDWRVWEMILEQAMT